MQTSVMQPSLAFIRTKPNKAVVTQMTKEKVITQICDIMLHFIFLKEEINFLRNRRSIHF